MAGNGPPGGSDGHQVTHYFGPEDDARWMLQRMLDTTPRLSPTGQHDPAAEEALSGSPRTRTPTSFVSIRIPAVIGKRPLSSDTLPHRSGVNSHPSLPPAGGSRRQLSLRR